MSDIDQSKDLVFAQPQVPAPSWRRNTDPDAMEDRDWTVAEIEEVMWRIRAAGGTDSTPIKLSYKSDESIKALHVEAFPIEIPQRMRETPKAIVTIPAVRQPWTAKRVLDRASVAITMMLVLIACVSTGLLLVWLGKLAWTNTIGG